MAPKVEHFIHFYWLFVFYFFRLSVHLLIHLLIWLISCLGFFSYLCSLDTNPLSYVQPAKIFCHLSLGLSVALALNRLQFREPHLSGVGVIWPLTSIVVGSSCPCLLHLFLWQFRGSGCYKEASGPFRVNFLYRMSNKDLVLFFYMLISRFPSAICWKGCFPIFILVSFPKIKWLKLCGFMPGFSVLFQ